MSQQYVDPDTGEITEIPFELDASRLGEMPVDALVSLYQEQVATEQRARCVKMQLVQALASRAPRTDDCRTTRIRGDSRRVKVEWPGDSWDSATLKAAWCSFPELAEKYLAIERVKPRLVEIAKMQHENGNEDFHEFKKMVLAANRGPQGAPRIVIEE